MAGPGLYTASLSPTTTPDILNKPSLLPYPSFDDPSSPTFSRAPAASPIPPPIPLSIAITQWHWLLLYDDRLVAIARENEKIVWEESLPLVRLVTFFEGRTDHIEYRRTSAWLGS